MSMRSHPSRVRGLKFMGQSPGGLDATSHPSRVRGLKSSGTKNMITNIGVAPFTGAWIERLSWLSSERPFYWHQNLFDAVKVTWDRIYLYRQYFKSSNPILHRVPHSQPGRCGLFLCGNRVHRPVSRPGRRRGRFCRVWLP